MYIGLHTTKNQNDELKPRRTKVCLCIGEKKKEKEDYLKCESDIRKSIKTFPFTLLYPLFVITKAEVVCLITF